MHKKEPLKLILIELLENLNNKPNNNNQINKEIIQCQVTTEKKWV
jgi:hypothetical protein